MDESSARLGFFLGILILIGMWEIAAPRRGGPHSILFRWANNFGLVVFNTALMRLIFPTALVGIAVFFQETGWGLFNILPLPFWLEILFALVLLDLAIYWQHKMLHAVPLLWRIHRMHHTDIDFDVSTGVRFHPIEIILSMCIKIFVIALLGAAPLATVVFEIVLSGSAIFSHGNILIPRRFEIMLRRFLVTPDMHRIHHSIEEVETNSNFGFCLSWWDRIFATYREEPKRTHTEMCLGLGEYRSKEWQSFVGLLRVPFAKTDGS